MRLAIGSRKVGRALAAMVLAATTILSATRAPAQCQTLRWTFDNPAPAASDNFGYSVAISGNYAVAGAYHDDTGATDAGTVYVYQAYTGALLRTINNPTPEADDRFGASVALSGTNLLVGAPHNSVGGTYSGSAFLFDVTTGALLRTFDEPTPTNNENFGVSVAMDGNNVVVGADQGWGGVATVGRAYLFDAATGALVWTFGKPSPVINDRFGRSVSISGNLVLVGDPSDNTGASDGGRAFLFDITTGAFIRSLSKPTPVATDNLGESVALTGSYAVVGIPNDDAGNTDGGAVRIFDPATGALLRTIGNPFPAVTDNFGRVLAISGDDLIIGCPGDDIGASNAGRAYLHNASTGSLVLTISNPAPAIGDAFGSAVAISSSGDFIAGANLNDVGGTDTGSAYVYGCPVTPTPSLTPSVSPTESLSPTESATPTISPTPTESPTPSLTPTETPSRTPTPSISPSLTPTPPNPTPVSSACGVLGLDLIVNNPSNQVEEFGRSVSISGNYLLVGAPGDPVDFQIGKAMLFNLTTGALLRTWDNPTGNFDVANFGHGVAVSANYAIVGAMWEGDGVVDVFNAGVVYVYNPSTGGLIRTIDNPNPGINDEFGSSVAISGSKVAITARRDGGEGAVHVYNIASGGPLQSIPGPGALGNDSLFGEGLAFEGDNLLVSAPYNGTTDRGIAYLIDASTGSFVHTFSNPDPQDDDHFGYSVGLSGNYAVIGTPGDDTGGDGVGVVYLFDITTGSLLHTFNNPAPSPYDFYGLSVAISGDRVLVGAPAGLGGAYLYEASTGSFLSSNLGPPTGGIFADEMTMVGDIAVIANPYTYTGTIGTVYVFSCGVNEVSAEWARYE